MARSTSPRTPICARSARRWGCPRRASRTWSWTSSRRSTSATIWTVFATADRTRAMTAPNAAGPTVAGVPLVFPLFAATLAGVLIAHRRATAVALAGLTVIAIVRIGFSRFDAVAHVLEEWP